MRVLLSNNNRRGSHFGPKPLKVQQTNNEYKNKKTFRYNTAGYSIYYCSTFITFYCLILILITQEAIVYTIDFI
jgi:hypothetical protein